MNSDLIPSKLLYLLIVKLVCRISLKLLLTVYNFDSLYFSYLLLFFLMRTMSGHSSTILYRNNESRGCLLKGKVSNILPLSVTFSVSVWRPLFIRLKVHSLLLLLLLSCFSHVRLCATPQTAAHQASSSMGFSREEHWSGLPFPSPMHESEK